MLGNGGSKMDLNHLNGCIERHRFLSPRFSSCFSSYSQRTDCKLCAEPHVYTAPNINDISSTKHSSPFLRLFSSWRASCESDSPAPKATDRMERARESLKQLEGARAQVVSEVEIQNYLAKETGKDRLQKMFTRDHLGNASPEMGFIYGVTVQSAAATFLFMTVLAGRQAKQDFIDRNRATIFKTRFQAFRRLQDTIFLFSMKEGAKWAARVSLFTLSLLGISQSIAVYRNKSSPWEYSIACAVTIGLLKTNMGLRGCLVGTGFGAVAGLLMGVVVLGGMKALNETQEQRHYWQIQKEIEREKFFEVKGKTPERLVGETA